MPMSQDGDETIDSRGRHGMVIQDSLLGTGNNFSQRRSRSISMYAKHIDKNTPDMQCLM